MKRQLKSYVWLIVVAGIIIALDQWTKWLVRTNLQLGDVWSPFPWLTPYARIVHWYNTGVAFGMFQGMSWLFAGLSILVSIAIIIFYGRIPANEWPLKLSLMLQLGGAIGNLIDRLTVGQVTDFISVGKFAVFNIADSSLTVGVIVMILGFWYMDLQEKKKQTQKPADQSTNEVDR